MSSHSRPLQKRFSEEVAVIVRDLSTRLEHLLDQHEACLLNTVTVGEERYAEEVNPTLYKGLSYSSIVSSKNLLFESSRVAPTEDAPTMIVAFPGCIESEDIGGSDPIMEEVTAVDLTPAKRVTVREIELRPYLKEICMDDHATASQRLAAYSKNDQDRNRLRASVGMKNRDSQMSIADENAFAAGFACLEIMHPSSGFRTIWNFVTLGLIIFDMLTIPLLVFNVGDTAPWEFFAWFCTLFWTADMIMSARTGFFVGAKVEMRQKPILMNYAKSWLPVDSFIVLFEWFSRFFNTLAPPNLIRTTRVIRIIRLVKLARIAKMKDLVNEFAGRINSNVLYLVLRIVFLTLILCVACHFMTCAWYMLGESVGDGWTSYDMYAIRDDLELGFVYWYVSSARWAISQLNGRTDMDERRNMRERGFTVIGGVVFAILGQAIFISLITKSMIELSSLFKEQQEKRRIVNEYLSLYPIPVALERCVKALAKEHKDVGAEKRKEGVVLSLLPKHLQTELLYEARKPFMIAHPLFKCIFGEFKSTSRHICQNVVNQVHAVREEVIFGPRDASSRMLMMDMGSLIYGVCDARETMMQSGLSTQEVLAQMAVDGERLSRGQWVAEASLWCVWQNKGTLITDDSCCMLEIDEDHFATEIQEHNDALPVTCIYAKSFLTYLNEQDELSDIVTTFTFN